MSKKTFIEIDGYPNIIQCDNDKEEISTTIKESIKKNAEWMTWEYGKDKSNLMIINLSNIKWIKITSDIDK